MEIVRPMIDSGAALAVMGNHELNALAFHTPDPTSPATTFVPMTRRTRVSTRRRCVRSRQANSRPI
jgi:hypothetical protein